MNLGASERVRLLVEQVRAFITDHVDPVESEYFAEIDTGNRWQLTERQQEIIDGLQLQAREQGLWNFFLTHSEHGPGLTNVEYAYLAEEMGRSHLAPEVFNCQAPDTGNMEVIARFGSTEQKREWLQPLLEGQIRSGFAMTEPDEACSDASNVAMTAVLKNGNWLLNGEKTYISGAGDPRCKILIVMARTDPDAPKHKQQSQILVPMDTPGLTIVRPMHVFSMDDAPHGHMHLRFDDVEVPEDNIILGRGRGFEIAQSRLGPGRIHHCMRAIGAAELALEFMCRRGLSRRAFGKEIIKLGGNFDRVADARMQIEMARLLTLKAAWMIDSSDIESARVWVSMIKVIAPNTALKIIDDAIQMHGAAGVSQDFPLAKMYMSNRTLRLADGPDEVHRMVVARSELRRYLG
ncbi:MAG: acyl-CoA dehydrogenase family protein [Gammaproteobacteria bacterium]